MYFPPSAALKLGVQKHSNRCRVSGGDNFLRRNDIDIPTAGDFFSRRLTAAMFAGIVLILMPHCIGRRAMNMEISAIHNGTARYCICNRRFTILCIGSLYISSLYT